MLFNSLQFLIFLPIVLIVYYLLPHGWRLQNSELRQSGFLSLEASANTVTRAVAHEQGVPLVDAAAALSGDPRNFADHEHFTDLGSRRMADLLTGAVLGVLKP
jgi:lysophospholipase L1-like esterase